MRVRVFAIIAAVAAVTAAGAASAQDPASAAKRAAEIEKAINSSKGPRIVGGDNANPGDIPWQAGLVLRSGATRIYCGGSFIRPNIVMTAGHCVTRLIGNTKLFKIVSGAVKLDDPNIRSHDITDIIIHPRYNEIDGGLDYDFALIRVAQPFAGRTIDILTPADNDRIIVGTSLQVSGWGDTLAGGVSTVNLQKLNVPVVGRADCNDANSYNGIITSRMICAGYQAGNRDSCNGDSGGPITLSVGSNQRRLVGVVSFGDSCAAKDKYGVYGRLHSVRDWINASVAQLSQN